jgi:hypothetical protein
LACEIFGLSPFELIAAAHAACFSMTLAKELVSAGFTPQRIVTTATVTMEPLSVGGPSQSFKLTFWPRRPGRNRAISSGPPSAPKPLYDLAAVEDEHLHERKAGKLRKLPHRKGTASYPYF